MIGHCLAPPSGNHRGEWPREPFRAASVAASPQELVPVLSWREVARREQPPPVAVAATAGKIADCRWGRTPWLTLREVERRRHHEVPSARAFSRRTSLGATA